MAATGLSVQRRPAIETREWVQAAENGDESMVAALLAGGADPNARLKTGQTALMSAAASGYPRVVRMLLAAGADVNAKREDGFTALLTATFLGNSNVIGVLIDHGADLNATTTFGSTAKSWASSKGFVEILDLLEHAESSRMKSSAVSEPGGSAGSPETCVRANEPPAAIGNAEDFSAREAETETGLRNELTGISSNDQDAVDEMAWPAALWDPKVFEPIYRLHKTAIRRWPISVIVLTVILASEFGALSLLKKEKPPSPAIQVPSDSRTLPQPADSSIQSQPPSAPAELSAGVVQQGNRDYDTKLTGTIGGLNDSNEARRLSAKAKRPDENGAIVLRSSTEDKTLRSPAEDKTPGYTRPVDYISRPESLSKEVGGNPPKAPSSGANESRPGVVLKSGPAQREAIHQDENSPMISARPSAPVKKKVIPWP